MNLEDNYLDHAEAQAKARNLHDFPIVDADCHYISTPLGELAKYVPAPWKERLMTGIDPNQKFYLIPNDLGDRTLETRMKSLPMYAKREKQNESNEIKMPPEIYPLLESSAKMGFDYNIVFPTDLLTLGVNPQTDLEVAIAFAYARWMTEEILPKHDSIRAMLYLPFSDPDACVRLIKEFGDKKGVSGFLVTSARKQGVHDNSYMPVYELLEDKGLALGFHTVDVWMDEPLRQFNRFMSAHALGFPLYNMIHTINLIVNVIPERFPNLKIVMIEAGVTWIPFVMSRLDSEYLFRPSEAPLLKKKPSEYMRNFYFTSQPLEFMENQEFMKSVFDMIDAENQLLFASDYPHQDFDLPSKIYDMPFLSEKAKRKILGENALHVFDIDDPKLLAKENLKQFK